MAKVRLPDSIHSNEIRIYHSELSNIKVQKFSFPKENAKEIRSGLNYKDFIPLFRGNNNVFLFQIRSTAKFPKDLGLIMEDSSIQKFTDLPETFAKTLILKIIEEMPRDKNYYRSGFNTFFSKNTVKSVSKYAHYSVGLDVRTYKDHYKIFIDPTIKLLIPITKLTSTQLETNRKLIRLVDESNIDDLENNWGLSPYPKELGVFEGFEESEINESYIQPNDKVLVKRTPKASKCYIYPAYALRVSATKEEIKRFNLTQKYKKETQIISNERHKLTGYWISRLFPDNKIKIGDTEIGIENVFLKTHQPSMFPDTRKKPYLWFKEPELLFNPEGDAVSQSQASGLNTFGPLDQNFSNRKVSEINPIIIVPNNPGLIEKAGQLFEFLQHGYQVTENKGFRGIENIFKLKFKKPSEDDYYEVNGSIEDYESAAKRVIKHWKINEDREPSRVVIVVVPDQYDSSLKDPYSAVKKLFLKQGLPSQMIEFGTLNKLRQGSPLVDSLLLTFSLDLYVKMGGKPWTLLRDFNDVNCFIGIGFAQGRREGEYPIYVGIANIFDNAGQWLNLSSENKNLTSQEYDSIQNREFNKFGTGSYKLHESFTRKITYESLENYRISHNGETALKIVLHKNGPIYDSEAIGFIRALTEQLDNNDISIANIKIGIVSIIQGHGIRLYGPENIEQRMDRTISRGSAYSVSDNSIVLATTGKNQWRYPGIGTPKPIIIDRYEPSSTTQNILNLSDVQLFTAEELCEQVFALTRLHWGSIRDIRLPVTSDFANKIARLLAKTGVNINSLDQWEKLWWI